MFQDQGPNFHIDKRLEKAPQSLAEKAKAANAGQNRPPQTRPPAAGGEFPTPSFEPLVR